MHGFVRGAHGCLYPRPASLKRKEEKAVGQIHNRPVEVTGYEERRRIAIRKLARVCIELARLRLGRDAGRPQEKAGSGESGAEGSA
jgi:hypothetical protein